MDNSKAMRPRHAKMLPLSAGLLAGLLVTASYLVTAAPANAQQATNSSYELRKKAKARALAKKRRKARRLAARKLSRSGNRRTAKLRSKKKSRYTSSSQLLANAKTTQGSLQIVVSLPEQRMAVYKGGRRIALTSVSTGRSSNPSPTGIYSILQKRAVHFSNLYNNAPMPNMQRLTWSGIALHGGKLPGYPASRGCIRQPYKFAKALFRITRMNDHVIMTKRRLDDVAPQTISSQLLFQSTTQARLRKMMARLYPQKQQRAAINAENSMAVEMKTASSGTSGSEASGNETGKLVETSKLVRVGALKLDASNYPATAALGQTAGEKVSAIQAQSEQSARNAMIKLADFEMLVDRMNRVGSWRKKSLRILIARRSARNNNTDAQTILKALGYKIGAIDGRIGKASRRVIKSYQEKQGLAVNGKVDAVLMKSLYRVANRPKPANGRLVIRQGYRDIFSAPVQITDAGKPLGTHLFVASVENGADKTSWTVLTTGNTRFTPRGAGGSAGEARQNSGAANVSTANDALARINMPEYARNFIADRLTSGTSLLIADNGYSSETGKTTDFIVETR